MLETLIKAKLAERVLESFSKTQIDFDFESNPYVFDFEGGPREIKTKDIKSWEDKFKRILTPYLPSNANCYIAGGSVLTYILYGNELMIRDFDIFTSSEEEYKRIEKHLTDLGTTRSIVENNNTKHFSFKAIEIDLIKKTYPTIHDCLSAFDINICKVGFNVTNDFWEFRQLVSFNDIFSLRFTINNFENINFKKDGIKTLKRVLKYTSKGFKPERKLLVQLYARILLIDKYDTIEHSTMSEQVKKQAKDMELEVISKDLTERLNDDYRFIDDEQPTFESMGPITITTPIPTSSFSSSSGMVSVGSPKYTSPTVTKKATKTGGWVALS